MLSVNNHCSYCTGFNHASTVQRCNCIREIGVAFTKMVYRLQFCDKETQLKYFKAQFELAAATSLPMFLHLRAAAEDFLEVLQEQQGKMSAGVVHSFDGSAAELNSLLEFSNIYIGAPHNVSFKFETCLLC